MLYSMFAFKGGTKMQQGQLQGPLYNPEPGLPTMQSFYVCSPHVHVDFLRVLQFPPPTSQKYGQLL